MLTTGGDYHDLCADHHQRRTRNPARRAARLLTELHTLGYRVTLEPVAAV